VRWGELVLLTVLASPHLIAYDLVLLTLPLLVFADWAVRHSDHPLGRGMSLLLVLVYFAPFSGHLARLIAVQLSVVVMAILAWRIDSICASSVDPSPEARRSCVPRATRFLHTPFRSALM
jgi:hypothetical protein